MAKPKLVLIEWEDAAHEFGWLDEFPADNPAPHICHTVGWMMVKTRKHVVVAQTISGEDALAQTLQIPMGMAHPIKLLTTAALGVSK